MPYEAEPEACRRRYQTTQEKWLIDEEAQLPKITVAEVARRRGFNNSQVFSWIRAAKVGKLGPRP
ncbi:transposase [Shinella sp. DD12]|uniref:transposase n=1 Tax=Shinella sp. DD12 TaxID=1410620 RepID=UPI0009DF648B